MRDPGYTHVSTDEPDEVGDRVRAQKAPGTESPCSLNSKARVIVVLADVGCPAYVVS